MTNDEIATMVWQNLDRARNGDSETAFFTLLEADGAVVPELKLAYQHESDAACRALIVEVLWQRRDPSAVSLLSEAINDPAAEVWQTALDGLVAIGSPEALAVLREAKKRATAMRDATEEFVEWVEEAIEQINEQAQHK